MASEVTIMTRKRRKYPKEFKLETVKLVKEGPRSIGEVARDLDLTESAVRNWVRQFDVDDPLFEILQERGLEVIVVNAREVKTVPGRKSDVSDAQWLQQLHQYGLLRASFRPTREIAELRSYLRQRERLLDYAAAHIRHRQKALTQMNVQLHHVVSDITGVTGLRIIREMAAGVVDPDELAKWRDSRCKASLETIREALVGHYQPESSR